MINNFENEFNPIYRIFAVMILPFNIYMLELLANENNIYAVLTFILIVIFSVFLGLVITNQVQDILSANKYKNYLSTFNYSDIKSALEGSEKDYKTKKELSDYLERITPNFSKYKH
jgi:uncharacterized membrane protein